MVSPGAAPAESSVVLGVACRKSLAHKRMRSSISQPRIMLLAGGLEPALAAPPGLGRASASSGLGSLGNAFSSSVGGSGGGGGGHAKQSSLSSFDAMLDQERHSLAAAVDRIASFSPDVLLVERSVARWVGLGVRVGWGRWRWTEGDPAAATCHWHCCRCCCLLLGAAQTCLVVTWHLPRCLPCLLCCCRYAQELLLQKDVSLVLNVKLELLERLARCMGSQVGVVVVWEDFAGAECQAGAAGTLHGRPGGCWDMHLGKPCTPHHAWHSDHLPAQHAARAPLGC